MPELPEVETIQRQLKKEIKGKQIKRVEVRRLKIISGRVPQGARIIDVFRRGKLLIFELSKGSFIVHHLKLTGQLIYNGAISKHTRLIYYFTDKTRLVFNDLRQFGYLKVFKNRGDLNLFLEKENLGPEPLEKNFTLDLFKKILGKRKKSRIKPLLMDQKFIAGIGNIYASEILFFAKVLPARKVDSLKPAEVKRIYQGIKKILSLAINKKGVSADRYVDAYGREGRFMPLLKVYQREGQPCFFCGALIKRKKMGQRSSFFCPRCQK